MGAVVLVEVVVREVAGGVEVAFVVVLVGVRGHKTRSVLPRVRKATGRVAGKGHQSSQNAVADPSSFRICFSFHLIVYQVNFQRNKR